MKRSSPFHKPIALSCALVLLGLLLGRSPLLVRPPLEAQPEQEEGKSAAEETSGDSMPFIASSRRLKWTLPSLSRPVNVNARTPRDSRPAIRATPRDYVDPRLALLPRRAETPPPDPEG